MNEIIVPEVQEVDERRWQAWKERGRAGDRQREKAARVVFALLAIICGVILWVAYFNR